MIRKIISITTLILLIQSCSEKKESEKSSKNISPKEAISFTGLESLVDPSKAPFHFGLASGDPTQNAVIIWTRVLPEFEQEVSGEWFISEDPGMKIIFKKGNFSTSSHKDYTVKIDVEGLNPGTVYYYCFEALNKKSIIGRTKTLPKKTDLVRLGFASCSDYAWGYFNAYRLMGDDTLDAVIHLGDYIYEHEPGVYEANIAERKHIPGKELISLQDYRTRYAQYRLDEDLQYVHSKHPFITIWDDHELANNAYNEGAGNHDSTEGNWKERLAAAKKAYYEWMPIRENNGHHYRSFSFGDLANLIMLDTRTEERTKQPEKVDLNNLDTSAHIINKTQMDWLMHQILKNHQWKILGNQILFSDLFIYFSKSPQLYNDGWSAYRNDHNLIEDIMRKAMNTIIVTGDFHSSFGIIKDEGLHSESYFEWIEFVVPSITSANYDEENSPDSARIYKKWYDDKNKDLFFSNLTDHGYFRLELTQNNCSGEFVFVKNTKEKNSLASFTETFYFSKKGLTK